MSSSGPRLKLSGLPTASGLAVGPAFVYRGEGELQTVEYAVEPGCEGDEALRLKRALADASRDLASLVAVLAERTGRDDVKVFEGHQMMLEDPLLCDEAKRLIVEERLNAEAAVRKTVSGIRAQFERMNDPFFRERVRDLDDVERRLLKSLSGSAAAPCVELKVPSVIVADELTPSETVQLPREFVLGFATNRGSTTSHVALLSRALGVPAVAGLGDVTERVLPGETMIVDGNEGEVTLGPDAETEGDFRRRAERSGGASAVSAGAAPAGTLRNGGEVPLLANFHPGAPFGELKEYGARGIGLYRSEYLWLNRELEPTEAEQFAAYREAAEACAALGGDAAVTIRVLDIGGDKLVRGISRREANPFLGNRSIRYLLSHPATFRTQLRAILRASAFGRVRILYPLVACVEELDGCAKALAAAKASLDADGLAYDRGIRVGSMIEVPSAALNAAAFAECVDFLSIGTNDLVQYTMAADRGNEAVAQLYQPTNPAVLRLVRMTISAAKVAGIPVSVCGESASDPVLGTLWAALGADSLSMAPAYVPKMSAILSRLTRRDLDEFATTVDFVMRSRTAAEISSACRAWLAAKVPDFEGGVR